ncbi:MAG TPA: glycoside hydrolase family 16 protein [Phycisphaerales bacterium]|nr:glycoside hydrolase family 16 protein [Phycisphaerales bacterium]
MAHVNTLTWKSVLSWALAAGMMMASPALAQECPPDGWIPTWSDEFSGTTLDTTKWRAENAALVKNNEQQYYHPSMVTLANGKMTIKSVNVPMGGRPYTSGLVETIDRFSQKFGRFEMRAKLPKTKGIWPAFWMLPQEKKWPPEIDIMELLGHQPYKVYMHHHWGTWPNVQSEGGFYIGPDFSQDFHTFRADWYADRIEYYVDDVMYVRHVSNIPAEPFYIIINTAVGGDWPGNPDGTTVFPQEFVVDWVRAYQYDAGRQKLNNPSFEATPALANWGKWGNAFTQGGVAYSGTQSAKLYGNFSGGPNTSGIYQDIPAVAGQRVRAFSNWYNWSSDFMRGANTCDMKIEWRGAGDTLISTQTIQTLTATSPQNTHMPFELRGTAPAGTTKARLVFTFNQPANASGAAFIDTVEFGYIDACIADFDRSGFVDTVDYDRYVQAFEAGFECADVDASGFVDTDDFDTFVQAFEAGC